MYAHPQNATLEGIEDPPGIDNVTRIFTTALLGLVITLTLLSCTSSPPVSQPSVAPARASSNAANLKATYAGLEEAGGKVFTLDPKASIVNIFAFRAGRAASKGHNHVLSAPQFAGFVYVPSGTLAGSRFDLEFRLDQLVIDDPQYRSKLGSAFATNPTSEDIRSTKDHMLGERNLQADRYPFVVIHSLAIAGEVPKLAARIEIELHGQKREMWVPLDVEGLPDQLVVTGSFVLRQSDFGIAPYSIFGGLLAVQDEMVIEFKLVGT